MVSYAIIGASRGLGLEYVRQLARRQNTTVFAIVRNATRSTHLSVAISGLKNVHVFEGDVTDHPSLERVAKQVGKITGGTLDYMIHVAARTDPELLYQSLDDYTSMDELDKDCIATFKINTLGAIHAISAFLPLLRAGASKKIIVLGSPAGDFRLTRAGSIGDMSAYCISKAGNLIATMKYAVKLKSEGFCVVLLSPGLVDTTGTIGEHGDAAGKALLDKWVTENSRGSEPIPYIYPEESVNDQLKVVDNLKVSDNGRFLTLAGEDYVMP
ncbi:NAD-P-binding protein [Lentinus tigrinus ALCF2SS1-7]|uniref:NAD-P-binding protein n=1 Tax=Lentinus tigrinus ALCF2SS1-6 TaxID=1328759 RepID=A0A5C2S4U2_9APHY|nr:NAD-P-binding protein [Lentinus tigrinus ALCF2SS1-6]RPD72803.1 NAD-P-binding protein [Lentinus tigrinus ALCF2SS1-7]